VYDSIIIIMMMMFNAENSGDGTAAVGLPEDVDSPRLRK